MNSAATNSRFIVRLRRLRIVRDGRRRRRH